MKSACRRVGAAPPSHAGCRRRRVRSPGVRVQSMPRYRWARQRWQIAVSDEIGARRQRLWCRLPGAGATARRRRTAAAARSAAPASPSRRCRWRTHNRPAPPRPARSAAWSRRVQRRACSIADPRRGVHRGQMLTHQARSRTLRADLLHGEADPCTQAQAQRGAQQLSPAGRAIDFDHVCPDHAAHCSRCAHRAARVSTSSIGCDAIHGDIRQASDRPARTSMSVRSGQLRGSAAHACCPHPFTHTTCRSVCTIRRDPSALPSPRRWTCTPPATRPPRPRPCGIPRGGGLEVIVQADQLLRLGAAHHPGPAPWLQLWKLSALPKPRTMKLFAPMLPGMMPSSPLRALTAPLRVTSTSLPK